MQSTTDLVLLPEDAGLTWDRVGAAHKSEQIVSKPLPLFCPVSKSMEDSGLEAADGVNVREKIVPDFGRIDVGALCGRKHAESLRGVRSSGATGPRKTSPSL